MNVNLLKQALLQKTIHHPDILSNIQKVEFACQSMASVPSDIAPLFNQLNNQPYLKLKPGNPEKAKPLKVGVVFSGGQAPGGHNVLWGLYDTLEKIHPNSQLLGFLDGPAGLIDGRYEVITKSKLDHYRNLGGFNMIGSGRTKIATQEQLKAALQSAERHKLDGFVIIGGDDSNTNAAILAQYFKKEGSHIAVIGVPKTIDGDLQNEYIEMPFGFDTACKLYSELIGNILTDALSSKKYYHFIKLMGRSASHIALECSLQTRPNLSFIGEEVQHEKRCLTDLVDDIVNMIVQRSKKGKNYGVILIPEGLIDFVPAFNQLNNSLNNLLAKHSDVSEDLLKEKLPKACYQFFSFLPENIQKQLLLDRDPHGNIQLAKIDTHKLLIELTQKALEKQKDFSKKFSPHAHYFGYEGRCANPTCLDAEYTYALGAAAALLVRSKKTGYMACVKNLKHPTAKWDVYGLPIVSLLNTERRHGKDKPVIKKALVNLNGKHFKLFQKMRQAWLLEDHYIAPGAIQHFGDDKISQARNYLINSL